MSRLQQELQRLFRPAVPPADGQVQAIVIETAGPPDWPALGRVWSGVQTSLGLPAPAIAISGTDAMQLWFALARPVAPTQARAFADTLAARYLDTLAPRRVRLWPRRADEGRIDGCDSLDHPHLPPHEFPEERWAAFVAPDLAPLFAETPWLDVPPGEDGQAKLLAGLRGLTPDELQSVIDTGPGPLQLEGIDPLAPSLQMPAPLVTPDVDDLDLELGQTPDVQAGHFDESAATRDEARSFLRGVLRDGAAPLALRVEAAKALLAEPPPGSGAIREA